MFAIRRAFAAAMAALSLASAAAAQDAGNETRIGEKDFTSPPATLAQMDWLIGQWQGEGIRGAPAMESWLKPIGGTMVGTFVQEDADGTIMFTEHMYLMQENGTLALKLKHFNADLTGWEEKDDFLTFRLVAIEECAVYFNALTLRCADRERPGEGMVAAVRMKSGGELVFRFTNVDTKGVAERPAPLLRCVGSTLEMNDCGAQILRQADAERARYLAAAVETMADRSEWETKARPELQKDMIAADEQFTAYREAECGALYDRSIMGSIRNMENLACSIILTRQRTHTIWRHWLTYPDGTPPILPEPERTPMVSW
ncbi:MAG: DUF6265 family protein [Pseudomonadota bacterium]